MSVNEIRTTQRLSDQASADVDKLANNALTRFNQITVGARRAAQIGIALATTFGTAIDQSLALGIEATLLSIEVLGAAAAGTFGLTSLAQVGAIGFMLKTIADLEAGRAENARRTSGIVSALRLLSFR